MSSADVSRDVDAPGAHQALRQGTAESHAALDLLFAGFDLRDRDDYGRFLTAHAGPVRAVEQALDAAGMADLLADWPARLRGQAILDDLAALDLPAPPVPPLALAPGPEAAWGAAYVIEGSRLGGALLSRQVAPGLPVSYLSAPQPKGAWRNFLANMDRALYGAAMHDPAIRSARAIFALFEASGRAALAR